MWRDYSKSYIKNNRASSMSIAIATLIATFFLSLLSSLFYNFWAYDKEMILQEEKASPLLALYIGILLIVSISLILIIRNSFELSMNARIHQFGIFSSIGATPKQIRICIIQEATILCVIPIILGTLLGIATSFGLMEAANYYASDISGRQRAVFHYHPMILVITMLLAVGTTLFSAWIPARKLSRMTPLEAIRNAGGFRLKKVKRAGILSLLFGIEGELAGCALKAQKKALRISTLSLLLSFLGFSIMLCVLTLSRISTRYTYFERYQDAWDIMMTIKDTKVKDFEMIDEIRNISGVRELSVYQKTKGMSLISEEWESEELIALGGLETVAGFSEEEGRIQMEVPIVILDDESFLDYCSQVGITPSLNGVVVLNRIWDSINSNFRNKEYIPFLKEEGVVSTLYSINGYDRYAEVPILSYAQEVPLLREEYDNYRLVHFISQSMWNEVSGQIGGEDTDIYIRILSDDNTSLSDLNTLEQKILEIVNKDYNVESENRIQEKLSNDKLITGFMVILGSFCILLALIGIANVFFNTLGFLRQRSREFAQYMSVGLTPSKMRKIFCIEAMAIAGRPLFITLPVTILFVNFAVRASYLEPTLFWAEAPLMPIFIFGISIVGFVALAYYIGARRILQCNLSSTISFQ